MPKYTFIICEKSFLVRKGLISIIEKIPDAQIVQQIDSIEELRNLNNFEADFIILNPNLLNSSTSKLFQLNAKERSTQLISLSEKTESNSIKWDAFININDTQNSILSKLKNLIGNKRTHSPRSESPEDISSREIEILKNIALGLSNKEIADKLFISTHTVVTHRKNITRKLGIKTVPGLTIYAILNKIININDTVLD